MQQTMTSIRLGTLSRSLACIACVLLAFPACKKKKTIATTITTVDGNPTCADLILAAVHYKVDNGDGGTFGSATPPEDWSATAALTIEIPLQRLPERNSYRAPRSAYDRSQRDLELLLANTERDVRDTLRSLDQL